MRNILIPILFFIFLFFILLVYAAFTFLSISKPRNYTEPITIIKEKAIRGKIYTNNYTLAKSKKYYGVYLYPDFLDPNKTDLFYKLFSIYSGIPEDKLKRRVKFYYYKKKIKRVLLAKVDLKTKQNLYYLNKILDKKRVFLSNKKGIRRGYEIEDLGFKRVYPYEDILEPVLGRFRSDIKKGENGLEEYYDYLLRAKQDGVKKGYRDVLGNIIYDGNVYIKRAINGKDLKLNINLLLQREIEKLLDIQKEKFKAREVIAAVMNSKTGEILAIASSNRFNPHKISSKDVANMKISAIRENFEPGSVMKPITFAILLEHNLVNPYEMIKGYNGRWKPKWRKKPIRDDEPFKWISAENVIVYSSNIGISQLALRLSNKDFYNGLRKFGFSKLSGIDLPYELKGKIRSLRLLQYPIYKTTTSYGYGILVNFIQLLKAYNVFNNNGVAITPRIAKMPTTAYKVISSKNAHIILNILRKVVLKGTGKAAFIKGIFTAGKTGTAHVVKFKEGYQKIYNSSFFGFANDGEHKYTIGVTFFDIKAKWPNYFASSSAVPTFKQIVDIIIQNNLLKVEYGK